MARASAAGSPKPFSRLNLKVLSWLIAVVAAFLVGREQGMRQARRDRVNELETQSRGLINEIGEMVQAELRSDQEEMADMAERTKALRSAAKGRESGRTDTAKHREAGLDKAQQ